MMSGSNHHGDGSIPTHQYRVIKLSTFVVALVLVVLIVAIGELYILRATGRTQVRQLACYVVRYSPDKDVTAKEIRAAYRCPPVRALPSLVEHPSAPRSTTALSSRPGGSSPMNPGAPSASSPIVTAPPAASTRAQPTTPPATSPPTPPPSPSGILGGLLCDPAALPICLKVASGP